MKRFFLLLLTALICVGLCSCNLLPLLPFALLAGSDATEAPEYTDMPLSGGGVEPGLHEDEYGYLILNRPEYVRSANYEPKNALMSYQTLPDDRARALYEKIYDACFCLSDEPNEDFDDEYDLRPMPLESMDYDYFEIETALAAVLFDHPEIFWMSMNFDIYDYESSGRSEAVFHTYFKAAEIVGMMEKLGGALEDFYSHLPPDLSPYEREVYIYSYIIDNCAYDYGVEDDAYSDSHPRLYNLVGMLVDHTAVCEGYARAFDYLCSSVGVETVCITGIEEDDEEALHIWNAVQLDDEWYLCDVTWDDWDENGDETDVFLYLNIDDKTMSLDHTTDKTYYEITEDEYWELSTYINTFIPAHCDATAYSYILRESVHLDRIDVDALAEGMVKAAEQKAAVLMVYADPAAFTTSELAEELFEGDQPYYEAMDAANAMLDGVQLDSRWDASYYEEPERNLIVFELNYKWYL